MDGAEVNVMAWNCYYTQRRVNAPAGGGVLGQRWLITFFTVSRFKMIQTNEY